MPGIYELLGGTAGVTRLREVQIADLLRRPPAQIDVDLAGNMLEGKTVLSAITSGGRRDAYGSEKGLKFSIRDLLAPFEQTVSLCRMRYLPPFVTHGTHLLKNDQIEKAAEDYVRIIESLRDGSITDDDLVDQEYINDIIP